jgi:hypothetical protein
MKTERTVEVSLAGVDHVVQVGHGPIRIGHDREVHVGPADLGDVAQPAVVAVDGVDRDRHGLDVSAIELGLQRMRCGPVSVVHTGVKSAGWLNSTAQEPSFQSWKVRVPSVVSAVKFGASSPSLNGHRPSPLGSFHVVGSIH